MWKTLKENIEKENELIDYVTETKIEVHYMDVENDKTILTLFESDEMDDEDTGDFDDEMDEDVEFLEACQYEETGKRLHKNRKPGNMQNKEREQYDITQDDDFDDDDIVNELDE